MTTSNTRTASPARTRRAAAASLVAAGLLAFAGGALAQSGSAAGLWKNIDDQTKEAKALIRISESADGVLTGRIEKILTGNTEARCDKCTDDRKDKPVQGLTILQGLKKQGEEWTGGEILDPSNGKVYRARVKLVDGGNKLDVRGYLGTPMFGRSQVWVREQ